MVFYGNRYNWTGALKEKLRLYYGPYGGAVKFAEETGIPLTATYKMAESMGLRQEPKDWYISTQGYKMIGKSDSRKAEHRLIVESALGRPLSAGEIVHHKDGDKLNNNYDNLVITTRASHARMHIDGRKHPDASC